VGDLTERGGLEADPAYLHGMERLVTAVQELSLARDLNQVMAIVRQAARELTGADGATFVLREGELCFYADEDAIAPLWKGSRFPMHACVSGWAMLHKQSAVIDDIYTDPRVLADAYRPTFVKSLAMVPIRPASPIGAIGNYWAQRHHASPTEVKLLQALADSTSVALEHVRLYAELEQLVKDRTEQLEQANRALEAFSYSVSHDLRAPLRSIDGFSQALLEDLEGKIEPSSAGYLQRVRAAAKRMSELIDDLLELSRTARVEPQRESVDVSALALDVARQLERREPTRQVALEVQPGLRVDADPRLLRVVLENLLGNAWKFTGKTAAARVQVGQERAKGKLAIYVRDNGAGFDMQFASKLFAPFQRLHEAGEFPGTGVGLATVQRIVHRHGGQIWAEAIVDAGATFHFTLSPG